MIFKICLAGAMVISLLSISVAAQDTFDAFWLKFKTAVAAKNKTAVADMVKLPFSLGYDPSARGHVGLIRTKAEFIRRFKYIFDGEVDSIRCFNAGKPESEMNQYVMPCAFRTEPPDREKPFLYTFQRTKAGWKLSEFTNINE